jgi:hypothetical protein
VTRRVAFPATRIEVLQGADATLHDGDASLKCDSFAAISFAKSLEADAP